MASSNRHSSSDSGHVAERKKIMGHEIERRVNMVELKDDVKAVLKILNGNGRMGLCAKVTVLWSVCLFLVISVTGLLLRAFILQ